MRIGILTFHSQINYGGVLQCVALQNVLSSFEGVEVRVIDRWMSPNKDTLNGIFVRGGGKLKSIIQTLLWPRMFMRQIRHIRSMRFVKNRLNLTPYHFYEWKDSPKDLGVDAIVVGSDQVWHCGDFGDPRPYLLEGSSFKGPVIAYAASFGIQSYPAGMREIFEKGLRRFDAISCREKKGCELVEEVGLCAEHVLDPTILANRDVWYKMISSKAKEVCERKRPGETKRVVCYFIKQDIEDALPYLEDFAKSHGCRVDVVTTQLRPHISTREKFANYCKWTVGAYTHVHQHIAAGPQEFLDLFAMADACITDSFHALMFSCVFNLNCRVLMPASQLLKQQFSRLEEFGIMMKGKFMVASVRDALSSFGSGEVVQYRYDKILDRRKFCLNWLATALKK